MKQIEIPQVGETMQDATLLAWRIQAGDAFQTGDVIFEIETEKVAFEVEASFAGTLTKILVTPGTTVATGSVVAEATSIL